MNLNISYQLQKRMLFYFNCVIRTVLKTGYTDFILQKITDFILQKKNKRHLIFFQLHWSSNL